jgi:drug/metabolite transporter (DMT)-like permease
MVLWLLVAGLFNAIAFVSLSRALALLPVSQVGALSALQTALSALRGVALFAEPLTLSFTAGLGLSVLGVVLSQQGAARRPTMATAEAAEHG